MLNRKILALAVLFLLALPAVLAVEDFTAAGTARILTYACSPAEGQITVTNTGDIPSAYELIAEGNAADWALFVPETFTLNPGQTQTVQEFIAVPCDAEDEFLDVAITTADLELLLTQDIIVQTANNLQLIPQEYSKTILACDTAAFSFLLKNPAEFAETYSLKLLDAPEQASISEDKITLAPGSNETIAVTIRPKDCYLSGEFAPVLVVSTEKSGIQAEIEMFLRINDTDIPEIAKGIETIRAGYSPQEASFEIFNTGDRITAYLLRVDGADWITVNPEEITVDPRDSENVKLILQPTETTPPGKYTLTLTARAEQSNKEFTKDFTIKLIQPTFLTKLTAEYLPFTIAGIVALIVLTILLWKGFKMWRSPEFQAKLAERRAENERRRQERIALKEQKRKDREEEKQRKQEEKREQEEKELKEAERHERELEKERIKAQREHDKELRRENLVIPKESILAGFKLPSKRVWKLALLLLILILMAFGIMFRNIIAANAQALLTGIAVLVIILLLHRLRRMRVARYRWKLALGNKVLLFHTRWRTGLADASFKLNTVVEKLIVVARKCKPSMPSPSLAYQTFVITPNVEADVIASARLKFKVKKSWMLKNRISPSTVKLMRLENDHWNPIAAEVASTDAKYVYYTADADGFGEFAITGKAGKKLSSKREWALGRIFGTILFAGAIIAAITAISLLLPGTPEQTFGIPAQTWKQNQQHTIELESYFKDPDSDPITFSATRSDHIDVQFAGTKAVLMPQFGWSGHERIVFMADDGKGGIVKSNPVDLIVEPPVIPASWKRYAMPVLTISAIILALFGAYFYRKKIKKIIGLE